jgi:hypothetical protein
MIAMNRHAIGRSTRGVGLLLVLGYLCLAPTSSRAGFEDVAVGARPLALGGSFVAIADDPNAIYWNPAGLTRMEGLQLMGTRAWPFRVPDLHIDYLAIKAPDFGPIALGFGWLNTSLKDILSENTLILSLAHDGIGPLSAGINLKYFRLDAPGYERYNDPAYDGAVSTWGLDVGALMHIRRNFTLGLSARNLNEPEISLLSTTTDPDVISRRIHLGAAYLFRDTVVLTVDMTSKTGNLSNSEVHAGGEIWFFKAYAVRVGTSQNRQSVGAGVRADHWKVDFALVNHQQLDNSYRLTVGLMY